MDKLEEHIRKNREGLDRYNPSKTVWKNINSQINKKHFPFRKILSAAAMIVVILATSVLLIKSGLLNSYITTSESGTSNDQGNSQVKETESYYNNLINSLYREATPMLTGNPEIMKELTTDISHLDSIYIEIKRDLKDNVANQDVVEALIQNYRTKIRLLEDMLTVLKENDLDSEKEKSHEL